MYQKIGRDKIISKYGRNRILLDIKTNKII